MKGYIYLLAAAMMVLATGCSDASKVKTSATEGSFTMMCDNSFENIMEQEIDVFEFNYPKVHVLQRYGTLNEVLDSLLSLNTKTVVLPRDLTKAEVENLKAKGKNPRSRCIAVDAVALIVNNDNKANQLSMDEIRDILSGKVSTWYELDPSLSKDSIRVLFDNAGSSMVKYMSDSLLNGQPLGKTSYAQGSIQNVIDGVRKNKNAMGVLGVSWLTTDLRTVAENAQDSVYAKQIAQDIAENKAADGGEINSRISTAGVKVLGVFRGEDNPYTDPRFMKDYDEFRAYKPFQTEIYKGYYPLTRTMYMVTTAYSDSPAGGFYSFMTGTIGQRVLQKTGVMPAVFRNQVIELVE